MAANYFYKVCMPDSDMDERAAGVRFPTKKVLPLMRATGDFCDGYQTRCPQRAWAFVQCIESAMVAMDQRLQGDTFQGWDHYHATSVNPLWNRHMKKIAEIGEHIFYRA